MATTEFTVETRPWLRHYDPGVPFTLKPYPAKTLCHTVAEAADAQPDGPAVLFKGARLSWAQVYRLSLALAAALRADGVEKGDRVALLMPNCPQAIIGQLGAWQAGAIVVPLNPMYTEEELARCLDDTGARTAIVLTLFYGKASALRQRTSLRRLIATNIKEYLPWPKRLLFSLAREKKEGHRVTLEPGDAWLGDLLGRYAGASQPAVPIGPDDPALLMFTGGTTGRAKAALSTHGGILTAAMQLRAWLGDLVEEGRDVIPLLMPMFHTYGNIAVFCTSLVARCPMIPVPNPRDLDDLITMIHETRPAFLTGVPSLFNALLNHPRVKSGRADFTSLKLILCGAAPLLLETKERLEELTGGRIIEAYGLTESVMAAVMTPVYGQYKEGAIGIPLPDVEVRIADPEDDRRTLPQGEVGHILMRAPQLMAGYWNDPERTAEAIRDGWLLTGDLGYLSADGYLFLVDRLKDLIKVSGWQVWPREVEEVLASHPAIGEVCVGGVPDPLRGEAVKAWVVLRPGSEASEADLRAYCREHLAAYKVPRQVEFCEGLPKSAIGKVLRRELTQREKALPVREVVP